MRVLDLTRDHVARPLLDRFFSRERPPYVSRAQHANQLVADLVEQVIEADTHLLGARKIREMTDAGWVTTRPEWTGHLGRFVSY